MDGSSFSGVESGEEFENGRTKPEILIFGDMKLGLKDN
jgi:hypothetical protein